MDYKNYFLIALIFNVKHEPSEIKLYKVNVSVTAEME